MNRSIMILHQFMCAIEKKMSSIATVMAYISGGLFLLLSLYVTIDVTSRKLGGPFTAVTDEISAYVLTTGAMWALAYALKSGGHVRVDLLLPYLPAGLRGILDGLAVLMMAFFSLVLSFYSWKLAFFSYTIKAIEPSFLETPLVIPQSLMAIGFSFLFLEAMAIIGVTVLKCFVPRKGVHARGDSAQERKLGE